MAVILLVLKSAKITPTGKCRIKLRTLGIRLPSIDHMFLVCHAAYTLTFSLTSKVLRPPPLSVSKKDAF